MMRLLPAMCMQEYDTGRCLWEDEAWLSDSGFTVGRVILTPKR